MGLKALPDKPDETARNTLAALWHTAAGRPISVQRGAVIVLPELGQEEIAKLITLVRERIAGAPLAYLTGRQQFMGVELIATAEALIPREETALLGNAALAKLRAIVRERGHAVVLDVCTGSGNLALALAWHEHGARVWAADLSEEAVTLARRNLAHLDLADRVEFRSGDLLVPFDTAEFHGKVDLLVCNPPYISSGKIDSMPLEIIGHEPRMAFDGGPLGIQILLRLISEATRFLRGGGWLAFEVGLGQGQGIRKRIQQSGTYAEINDVIDKNGQIRGLIARVPLKRERLPIEKRNDDMQEFAVAVVNVKKEKANICSLWRSGLFAAGLYEEKFDWYYERNPEGMPNALFLHHSSVISAVGIAVTGHRRMRFNDVTLLAGVLVDFVVRPEFRTLFPALLLQNEMRRLALQTHQIVWGLPNRRATAVFSRAGYQCLGQMVRYVRVVRSSVYLVRHLPRWMSRTLGPIIDWARLSIVVLRSLGTRSYVTQWQDCPDARFNDLWVRSAAPQQLMGVRDERYLTWRFVDSPFRAHSFFTLVSASDNRLIGYAACEFVQHAVRVSDFLVDSNVPDAFGSLWRELVRETRRMGCASLSVEFLGSALVQRELKGAGLVARDQIPLYVATTAEQRPLVQEQYWYVTCADVDG